MNIEQFCEYFRGVIASSGVTNQELDTRLPAGTSLEIMSGKTPSLTEFAKILFNLGLPFEGVRKECELFLDCVETVSVNFNNKEVKRLFITLCEAENVECLPTQFWDTVGKMFATYLEARMIAKFVERR